MRVVIKVKSPSSEPFVRLLRRLQGLQTQRLQQGAVPVQRSLDLPCPSLPGKDRVLLCFHEMECRGS